MGNDSEIDCQRCGLETIPIRQAHPCENTRQPAAIAMLASVWRVIRHGARPTRECPACGYRQGRAGSARRSRLC